MSWLGKISTRLGLGGASSNSRGVARERLSIILAHQRGDVLLDGIDLERLQGEVLQCVKVCIGTVVQSGVTYGVRGPLRKILM